MIVQKPLSPVLRLSYFSCSFVFAILMTMALAVVYLGGVPNPALNRIDVGGFVVGMLFLSMSLIAACWLAYLPLRRHPRIIRAATAVFALVVVVSLVFIAFIDWG